MARQQYETDKDLANEKIAAEKWLANSIYPIIDDCEVVKIKDHRADYLARYMNGEPICLLEIKCRKMSYGQYDTIFVAMHKYRSLIQLSKEKNIPAYLVWHLKNDDSMVFTNVETEPDFSAVGGRTVQTRDAYDVEAMAHWSFTRVTSIHEARINDFEVLA